MSRLLARLGAGLLVAFFVLAAIEFVVVTIDGAPPRLSPIELDRGDVGVQRGRDTHRWNDRWLWEPRPGATIDGEVINEECRRGPLAGHEKGSAFRIATLGDSSTFGMKVASTECWSHRLQETLRTRGHDVEVLNFGVIGFTAVQGASLYAGKVHRYRPDLVIAAFGCVNDQLPSTRGISDAQRIVALAGQPQRARRFLDRYAVFRLLRSWIDPRRDESSPAVGGASHRVSLEEFEYALTDLRNRVTADGGELLLVSPPRRYDGEVDRPATRSYTNALPRIAEKLDVPLANVWERLRSIDSQELGPLAENYERARASRLFVDEWHPSIEGHELYAETVADTILSAGLLRE